MFIKALLCMAVLFVIAWQTYWKPSARAVFWATVACLFLGCAGLGFYALPFVVLLFGTAVLCRLCRLRTRGFVAWSVALTFTAIGWGANHVHSSYLESRELFDEYSYVDVERRLSYERSQAVAEDRDDFHSAVGESPAGASRPRSFKDLIAASKDPGLAERMQRRTKALQELAWLHSGGFRDFAEQSLGLHIWVEPSRANIELPERSAVPLPELSPTASAAKAEKVDEPGTLEPEVFSPAVAVPRASSRLSPNRSELVRAHEAAMVDFVNPEGFGLVNEPDRVLGFRSHAFSEVPTVKPAEDGTRWEVVQLQLISPLKHHPPTIYAWRHLPTLAELRSDPIRPPDAFEAAALEKLHAGEELVVDATASELRMLGPLRMFEECRQCHGIRGGALLGAFTYRLRPVVETVP